MTDEQEYVYAIAHPHNYVKFGRSKNPTKRLKSFQTGSPYELWLLAALPVGDSERVEDELHDYYGEQQVKGEWFQMSYDDYDDIVDMMKMCRSEKDFDSLEDFHSWQAKQREAVK